MRRGLLLLVGCWCCCWGQPVISAEPKLDLRLTLPPVAYAVVGEASEIHMDNVILTEHPEQLRYVVTSPVGSLSERKWALTPTAAEIGEHSWMLEIFHEAEPVAQGEFRVRVLPVAGDPTQTRRLLIIGDSLTHATHYPNDLARRLSTPGHATWKFLGTHRPASALPGVAHEGYGGWTWQRFVTHYEPMPDLAQRKHSSPFVFLNAEQQPQLDLPRYFRESCVGETPDYITILLGINDCFSAKPDDPLAIDQRIDQMLAQAQPLLQALRAAAPDAEIGICLTPPPNARESGFEANYKGAYTRWGWKRIQHRLVQRLLAHFADQSEQRMFLIPTELGVDPVAGYPVDNGVHPNAAGYRQMGGAIHAWLMFRETVRGNPLQK